jgi:hypothetical protein
MKKTRVLHSHNYIETNWRHKHIKKIKTIDIKTQDRRNENMNTENTMTKDITRIEALKT